MLNGNFSASEGLKAEKPVFFASFVLYWHVCLAIFAFDRYFFASSMILYDAIRQMRQLSRENKPFSFSFMSYNSTKGISEGVIYVRKARLLERESVKYNRNAEEMEKYLDLDTMKTRHFWQPLLMTFNGVKVQLGNE